MINSNLFNYVNVLDKAADACSVRGQLISNNMANVNTPNYKRQDIEFNSFLEAALADGSTLDEAVANVQDHLMEINGVVYTDNSTLSYRLDGNNVSIDTEEVYQTENSIRYQALIDQMSQEFSRMKAVLK
ncbi:MAG: flagellar basal body rod protein FlgB [Lachnospiraceae bacterium]|nr:flagellar basal body rod protein FlgB [Lachnospiraceae bacterium]